MNDNPYASPRTLNSLAMPVESQMPRRGVLARVREGTRVGAMFGGSFGLLAGTGLGLVAELASRFQDARQPITPGDMLGVASLGLFCGGALGLLFGGFVGAFALQFRRCGYRRAGFEAAGLIGLIASVLGALGGALTFHVVGIDPFVGVVFGGSLSALLGGAGGLLLVVTLIAMLGNEPSPVVEPVD